MRPIVRLLEANVGARRLANVFDDFVDMIAIALRNAADPIGRYAREESYLQIAARYDRAQMTRFAEALAQICLEMEREPCDVLGRLYMELDLGNERLGQFYTPYDVARLISAMSADPLAETIAREGVAELYEPACGAGAFVIAMTQELRGRGIDYQRRLLVTAEDISAQAVHMAYVHLTLLHVPAVVHHRDTLTQEHVDTWPTLAYITGGWAHPNTEHPAAQARA